MAETVDTAEVAKFDALAARWWDPKGEMAPLHAMQPARLTILRDALCAQFGRDARRLDSLAGLRILDIGCGAGLVTEPLARLGAAMTGADASAEAIRVARDHAAVGGLCIDYRQQPAEELVEQGLTFDAVLALEIVEHVADVEGFLDMVTALVRPGGLLVLSTLNRTALSLALGIVAAEYVLRWLPPGTHDWRRFLRPAELQEMLLARGFDTQPARGIAIDPRSLRFEPDRSDAVNYVLVASRPAAT